MKHAAPTPGSQGFVFVSLDAVSPTPWRNGGGLTRDLLCWPDAVDWQVRISAADVTRSGPFSSYPGVARGFCVLQGAGVVLHFADGSRTLTPGSPPLHFDGAAAPGCELLAGATLDLNLMVRQVAGRGELAPAVAGKPWRSAAPLRAVFSLQARVLHVQGQPPLALPAHTLAYTEHAAGQSWQIADGHAAWWLAFEPHAR